MQCGTSWVMGQREGQRSICLLGCRAGLTIADLFLNRPLKTLPPKSMFCYSSHGACVTRDGAVLITETESRISQCQPDSFDVEEKRAVFLVSGKPGEITLGQISIRHKGPQLPSKSRCSASGENMGLNGISEKGKFTERGSLLSLDS